ncbi:ribulose-phosphate 3-epimerase [Candidatus Neomarinimicrobiota bacterium]
MKIGKRVKLAPSIMCANFANLESDIAQLEEFGVDYLHLDIMDGHFVPNLTMGPDVVKSIRKITDLKLDTHLMVEYPEKYITTFVESGADLISLHVESPGNIQSALRQIRKAGREGAIALNPETPVKDVEKYLESVSVVLMMCVKPGLAGRELVKGSIEKIGEMKRRIDDLGLDIEIQVDGNVGGGNMRRMIEAGADILVCGTSSIFQPGLSLEDGLSSLTSELWSIGSHLG